MAGSAARAAPFSQSMSVRGLSVLMAEPWLQLGPHRYRISGSIFDWEPHGALEQPYGEKMINLQLALFAQYSYLAVLVDGRDLHPLSAEVRTLYVHSFGKLASARMMIAVFGASSMTRVTQTLAMRALARLTSVQIELHHHDTREQAHKLLLQLISGI